MQWRRVEGGVAAVLERGEEVHPSVLELARVAALRAAFVHGLGAFEEAVLAFYDPRLRRYLPTPVHGVHEVANLTGNITRHDGKPFVHLHAVLAGRDLVPRAGHLVSARVGATLELFLRDLGSDIERRSDPDIGLPLWQL